MHSEEFALRRRDRDVIEAFIEGVLESMFDCGVMSIIEVVVQVRQRVLVDCCPPRVGFGHVRVGVDVPVGLLGGGGRAHFFWRWNDMEGTVKGWALCCNGMLLYLLLRLHTSI